MANIIDMLDDFYNRERNRKMRKKNKPVAPRDRKSITYSEDIPSPDYTKDSAGIKKFRESLQKQYSNPPRKVKM